MYSPFTSVVVVATIVRVAALYSLTVTFAIPGSPAS
jgi:hypothetical protein